MPTAPKLFGAFAFLLIGFFAAEMSKEGFPEGQNFGMYTTIAAFIGVLVGWRVMGSLNSETGTGKAITTGLRASTLLLGWTILFFAIREMLIRSTDRRYRGVQEALEGTFDIIIEYGQIAFTSANTMIVLVVGGVLGGMFANWAAARWN